jgi:hypothetical protein
MKVIEGNFRGSHASLRDLYDGIFELIDELPPETSIVSVVGILELIKLNLLEKTLDE